MTRAILALAAALAIPASAEAQTVAVQHVLAIDTPPFLSHAQYAAIMLRAVKALKYLPGWQ